MDRFLIRSVERRDADDLFRLARLLDSYNLPADRRRLATLVDDSRRSFAGRPVSRAREKYVFVLEDRRRGRVVGSSMIIAKHGTPGLPHLYLRSFVERRRSRTLGRTVAHHCFRLGATSNGPTELGGLVLLPSYRGRPERLGTWLSYVRFLFIAARRRRFQDTLLVEYLPAFAAGGESPFWNYFGRKFTGLSYRTADRLSIDNKEFVLSLFPRGTLYRDFFPEEIVRYLGRVGDATLPAARLLERMGFRFNGDIEPFDGGPYYTAATDRVPLIRRARRGRLRLVSHEARGPIRLFLADHDETVRALAAPSSSGEPTGLSIETARTLGIARDGVVWRSPPVADSTRR
jgi:arginine N-succinyltransferase